MPHRTVPRVSVIVATVSLGLFASTSVFAQKATNIQPDTSVVGSTAEQYPAEAPFLAENSAAMDKMMADMDVKPTGDIDADFAAMMIPHHQGAMDMALAYLRHGKNEQLRRIAQEIIVEQQQEIIAMHLALGQPLPPAAASQTQVTIDETPVVTTNDHASKSHDGMAMSPMNMK